MLTSFVTLTLASLALSSPLTPRQTGSDGRPTRQYFVRNNCPSNINLYIAGTFDSNIARGATVTKTLSDNAGFFYTDANGGSPTTPGTVRTAFSANFYYLVKDPNFVNVELQVAPRGRNATNGFCQTISCGSIGCNQAFPAPPTRFPNPNTGLDGTAPSNPYFECPVDNTDYDITFCPSGSFPRRGNAIHPNGNTSKCLDVRDASFQNGTPVQIYDCNGTPAQRWTVNKGSTKVRLDGTDFCLDAGSNPASGVGLKIWQCFDNLPAQQWNYTLDNRIALEGQG
ncbi:G-X-X-X-Q-X-W domain-containing protein [Panaeolus papilionaceus]|nr:G-X-X-X-Q-X-W domain-containing protein [Panaeolus papilionaceus]